MQRQTGRNKIGNIDALRTPHRGRCHRWSNPYRTDGDGEPCARRTIPWV